MLVLTRKKDEQIRIGDHIIVTVIRVKGKSVRLGIQAPRTEPVLRGELEFRDATEDAPEPPTGSFAVCSPTCTRETGALHRDAKRPLRDFLRSGTCVKDASR
jgi:carbon storage regulator CsrA